MTEVSADGALGIPLPTLGVLFITFLIACLWIYQRGHAKSWGDLSFFLKSNPVTWRIASPVINFLIAGWVLATIVTIGLNLVFADKPELLSRDAQTLLGMILHALVQIFMVVCLISHLKKNSIATSQALSQSTSSPTNRFATALACLVLAIPVTWAAKVYSLPLLEWAGFTQEDQQSILFLADDHAPIFLKATLVFIAVVVAPITEEIFFRGVLLPVLGQKLGLLRAIIYSSLFFALIHFHIPAVLPLFVLAVYLCLAYCMTRSIMVPIFMHMLFNTITILGLVHEL